MTPLEIERLIRKITELLEQGGNQDLASKHASDYAAACHATNLRLQQCEAMVKEGDFHQAIQLAETMPNLLDLITVLEFRRVDDWRSYCQQNQLTIAERIDARAVQILNACYSKDVPFNQRLYASYRKAILKRNDEGALKILQSIITLTPSDTNAASELTRLDKKVLTSRLDHLKYLLLKNVIPSCIVECIDSIEVFGFQNRPDGEVWHQAQIIRCGYLLEEVEKLKTVSRWKEAQKRLEFIRKQQKNYNLELSNTNIQHLATLETWVQCEQEKDKQENEFRALLAELHFHIHKSEEKDTSSRYVKLPELRDDFESLHKVWRSLTDFTRPIPEDATSAFRKRAGLLEAEIVRRTSIRRNIILISSGLVILFGILIGWLVLGQIRVQEFITELQSAISQRQTRIVERLLERFETHGKKLPHFGRLDTAIANGERFIAKERFLLNNFETIYTKLPKQLNNSNSDQIGEIADQLVQVRTALNVLSPDLKTEKEHNLKAFEKQWEQFLSSNELLANQFFDQWIISAEKLCEQIDYRASIDVAKALHSTLSAQMKKIQNWETANTNYIKIRSDLLHRSSVASAKNDKFNREFQKIEDGIVGLKKARTLNEYLVEIDNITSSEFSGAPLTMAASAVKSLNISEESTLRFLLNTTNASTWTYINNSKMQGTVDLIAKMLMPAEQHIFQRLVSDPAISANHHHFRLWLDKENAVDWITTDVFIKSLGWKQIKAWTPSVTATKAVFEEREYGYFDEQYKLTPTQNILRIEHVAELKETSAFKLIEFVKSWSENSVSTKPLLEILTEIKDCREGSSIFRAFLFLSLIEIMEFQPDAWGLSFCPSAKFHTEQIYRIIGGKISSGDWFVSSKVTDWSDKLDKFFIEAKKISYSKEAAHNIFLARSVVRDGLKYIGFIGLDGKPVLMSVNPPAEMWCYDIISKQPLLFCKTSMSLSPLFTLPAPRADYLVKNGINTDSVSSTNALPPLFRAVIQP